MAGARISGARSVVRLHAKVVVSGTRPAGVTAQKIARGEYGYGSWQADIQKIKDSRNAYKRLGRRKKWQRTIF